MPSTSDYLSDPSSRVSSLKLVPVEPMRMGKAAEPLNLKPPVWALFLQHPTCAGSPSPLAAAMAPVDYY